MTVSYRSMGLVSVTPNIPAEISGHLYALVRFVERNNSTTLLNIYDMLVDIQKRQEIVSTLYSNDMMVAGEDFDDD